MADVIHLKDEDITKELFDRAQFIFWATGGAMGEGGAVCIVADDGKSYYCNCVYGDRETGCIVNPIAITKACPMLEADEFPEDWVYHYLGFGNNLLYRREHDEEYCRLLGKANGAGYEYQNWHGVAVKLCSESK